MLYVPARLTAPAFGLVLTQHADLPASGAVRLDVSLEAPRRFALRLRVPAWASADIDVRIDGERVAAAAQDGFLVVDREWQGGESVELDLPLNVRTERLPDGSAWESVLVGPSVMALRGATRWRAGLRLDVRVVDPHFDAGEIRLRWQPAPPGHPFRIEVDGVEAGRVDDVTAGEVTVALAATDAAWGVRRIAIVSDDSLTPRLTELRVLRRLGEEPPAATD